MMTMANTPAEPRKNPHLHFWLVVGEVFFAHAGEMDRLQNAVLNAVLTTRQKKLNLGNLSMAQQSLQMQLMNRVRAKNENEIQHHDVLIHNIVYLGEFTQEEFNQRPPPAIGVGTVPMGEA